MADTAVTIPATAQSSIDTRTEGTNGNHRQVVVIGDPATNAGVAPVDATNGLSVTVVGPLPAGTAGIGKLTTNSGVDIGDVDVLSIAAGDNNIGNVDIASALPAGTNAIGKLAANSGVDIGDVDVTSVVPGTGASNLGKAEDAAHASADIGVMALAVRQDTVAALADTTSDYIPLTTDANGLLQTGPDGLATSGSVTSATTVVSVDMLGYESASIQTTSAGSGNNYSFESSNDNTNWVTAHALRMDAMTTAQTVVSVSTGVLYVAPRQGRYFRVRVSTYGSGTVTTLVVLNRNPYPSVISATIIGNVAHDGAVSSNPVRIGARAQTSNYTAVASGDVADIITDTVGKQIIKPYAVPELDWTYAAAASGISNTTTAVTIKAAAGAGLRNYITGLQMTSEALGAATEFAIRDGAAGTVLWRTKIGTAGIVNGIGLLFPTPLQGTANTLLEVVTLTASVTGAVYFNAQGYAAP